MTLKDDLQGPMESVGQSTTQLILSIGSGLDVLASYIVEREEEMHRLKLAMELEINNLGGRLQELEDRIALLEGEACED